MSAICCFSSFATADYPRLHPQPTHSSDLILSVMMRFSSFAVFLGLSVLAVASPLRSIGQRRSEHSLFAAEELIDYVASVTDDTSNQCDLSQAQQPAGMT